MQFGWELEVLQDASSRPMSLACILLTRVVPRKWKLLQDASSCPTTPSYPTNVVMRHMKAKWRRYPYPTSIAIACILVTGRPNARAGVKIVTKKERENP